MRAELPELAVRLAWMAAPRVAAPRAAAPRAAALPAAKAAAADTAAFLERPQGKRVRRWRRALRARAARAETSIFSMMFRRCVLALTCLLFVGATVTASGWARAQDVPTTQPEGKASTDLAPAIVLLFEPERPDSSRLIRAIESHLVGLPVRVVLEPLARGEILAWLESGHARARARQALGLVAIDTGQGDLWRVFFLDVEGAPTLIWRLRPSPERAPLDEAGVAVRLLVEALLDAKPPSPVAPVLRREGTTARGAAQKDGAKSKRPESSTDREPPESAPPGEAPTPEPPPANDDEAPRPSSEQRFGLFLGPTTTTWVANQGWQFGATAGVEVRVARSWSLALAYTWYPTLEYQEADANLSLSRHPAASYVAYAPVSGFSPRFWLGMWVDPVLRDTPETAATYQGTAAQTTWSWGPAGGIGVVSAPLSAFSARFDLGLEVDANRVEYVVQGETQDLLASTRRVRPFLRLCLGLRL
jgi:hypothetical protein